MVLHEFDRSARSIFDAITRVGIEIRLEIDIDPMCCGEDFQITIIGSDRPAARTRSDRSERQRIGSGASGKTRRGRRAEQEQDGGDFHAPSLPLAD